MRHSIPDLLDVVHRYYPRGVPSIEARHRQTAEHLALGAARRQAGALAGPWRALLRRLHEQFPHASVQNRSLHLPTGTWDACYSGALHLPGGASLGFFVSFLVPYYVTYSSRIVDDPEATEARRAAAEKRADEPPSDTVDVYRGNAMTVVRRDAVTPELMAELEKSEERDREVFTGETPFVPSLRATEEKPCQRQVIRFDFTPDEQPYAAWLARDIEATFGHERMPPEVGGVVVPDVETDARRFGEARIYDCLMSDEW